MDYDKLKKQFPFIEIKSENWYYNNLTKRYIHKDNIAKVLAYYVVNDFEKTKSKFNQIDTFKQKRK